jgi:uncharacterized protein YfcZ (UPF0381/DUF406 family)
MSNEYEQEVSEDSMAMDSLKPGSQSSGPDPKSKIEHMNAVISTMHGMKREDLTKWFHDAMALIGKEARNLPGSANEMGNENTIRAKPSHATGKQGPSANDPMVKLQHNTPGQSMREDVEEMFEGQDLSEEFKEKASTLFEAAVNLRAMTEIARLEEEYETKIEEAVEEMEESLQSKIDMYLDYVVETWMKDNQVAIESTLRNEITEEFIDGLKNLFAEHYIDVPADKVDVVESLAAKVDQLEAKLNEAINENVELRQDVNSALKNELIEEYADGLTLTQSEKFIALAEGLEYNGDLEKFARKLSVVKENYFSKKQVAQSNIEEETFEGETYNNVVSADPEVNRYAAAISRTVKRQ